MKTILMMGVLTFFIGGACNKKDTNLVYNKPFPEIKDNPSWIVNVSFLNPSQADYTEVYQYAYDTTLCSQTFIKVIAKKDNVVRHLCFIRIDTITKRVYIRKSSDCNEQEFLLYDFSTPIDQTLKCGFNLSNSFSEKEIILSINNIENFTTEGIQSKKIRLSYSIYNVNWEMNWIEGVGCIEDPFYSATLSKVPGAGIHKLKLLKLSDNEVFKQ